MNETYNGAQATKFKNYHTKVMLGAACQNVQLLVFVVYTLVFLCQFVVDFPVSRIKLVGKVSCYNIVGECKRDICIILTPQALQ